MKGVQWTASTAVAESVSKEYGVRDLEKCILLPFTNVVVFPFPIFLESMKVPLELQFQRGKRRNKVSEY